MNDTQIISELVRVEHVLYILKVEEVKKRGKLEQKILIDLRDYNLSLSYITIHNNVSDSTVRNVLNNYLKKYSLHLRKLPSVLSFDEFKADTRSGKYTFIVNDLLHSKTLDI